jgi:hypothetical protein
MKMNDLFNFNVSPISISIPDYELIELLFYNLFFIKTSKYPNFLNLIYYINIS